MDLRTLLLAFMGWVLYVAWLIAGAADYFCHRRTHIERTSGSTESWLHVAQFACIAIAFVFALLLEVTALVFLVMLAAVVAHTILSYADVAYTLKRRHISPLEQHVHGFLDVIPLVAVGLIGVLDWPTIWPQAMEATGELNSPQPALGWKEPMIPAAELVLLLGSFFILAGVPVFEELSRVLRSRAAHDPDEPAARQQGSKEHEPGDFAATLHK